MKTIHLLSFITDHGSCGSHGFFMSRRTNGRRFRGSQIAEIAETTICLVLSVASVQSVFVFSLNAHQRS